VSRLFALVLVVALAAGAMAAYNFFVFGVAQPFPLSWSLSEDELRLVELERERQALAARLGAGQRATSLAGAPQLGAPDAGEQAALARLDAEITALRARIASPAR
jgi:hypothetical protein